MFNFICLRKCVCVAVLSVWGVSISASSAESNSKRVPGKVVVANVVGKAEAIDPKSQSSQVLKTSDVISEKSTVKVREASKATLVFSNGSTINLLQNSSLAITEFLQDPFSGNHTTAILTEEPTTSVTRLNLVHGEVICNVKKLRTKEGSSFVINTPVGAAGVRGTTLAVSLVMNSDGTATYTLSVTKGAVDLKDSKNKVTGVTAGKEVVIKARATEDPKTGKITLIEVISFELRDISKERQKMINAAAADGEKSALMQFVDFMNLDHQASIIPFRDAPPVIINPKKVTEVDPKKDEK